MGIFGRIDTFITWFDGVVWGLPLIILILVTGIFLTVRLGLLQVRYLGKALKFMVKNEEDGHGEVTSFGALCTALFIRQKMSDIVCCFVHFYIVSADCMDRIALDEIGENRRTGDLIRT